MSTDQPTYADKWADAINETYTDAHEYVGEFLNPEDLLDGEDYPAAERRVLTKAADCLRGGATHTFSGSELDLVRHLMPAHEVHQSGARRWVLEVYGTADDVEEPKLWIGSALTPYGNEYGLVAVIAETREEAIAKAKLQLDDPGNYVPNQRYAKALLDNLAAMREATDEVFVYWEPASGRRR